MPNCRSIPPAVWKHATEALVFYFSRRHCRNDAEDLAQDTLAAVLTREDFEFEKEEDFLRVCYGFAARISQAGYREARKHAAGVLDPDFGRPPTRRSLLNSAEASVLLEEVLRTAQSALSEKEWALIQRAAIADPADNPRPPSPAAANNIRVSLHRARRKLAKLTGWTRS